MKTPRFGVPPHETLDQELAAFAQCFDAERVASALARGANPNARQDGNDSGPTALMRASECSDESSAACVSLLLAAGADPNLADRRGETALMWAANFGNRAVVEMLIGAGADVDAKDVSLWGAEQFAAGSSDASFIAWMAGACQARRDAQALQALAPAPSAPRSSRPSL